ncbi:MAG: ABC transporter permease [Victivallales bacterium]|nr:ABC transporter permease [Victivallales bacterium]
MMAGDPQEWKLTKGQDGCAVIVLSGDWLSPSKLPDRILDGKYGEVRVEGGGVQEWNTALAVFLFKLSKECKECSAKLEMKGIPEGASRLVALSMAAPPKDLRKSHRSPLFIVRLGENAKEFYDTCMVGVQFFGELLLSFWHLLRGKARMRWEDVWNEIIKAGPKALFIVCLIGFLMGLILAFIGSIPLKWFRAEVYVASLIGIGMLRLMAVVMTGTVMAGRTGAAYAAELGTMQVNEEIDALESMGISPMEYLVLPRVIALTLMMPFLCLFADIIGVLGGMVVGVFYMGLSSLEYWQQMSDTTRVNDLLVGLFTSLVFAVLIALCGCIRGIRCGRSSDSVGQATTAAMVSSLVCLVIATAIITVITVNLKI